jgi:hypothetical protein
VRVPSTFAFLAAVLAACSDGVAPPSTPAPSAGPAPQAAVTPSAAATVELVATVTTTAAPQAAPEPPPAPAAAVLTSAAAVEPSQRVPLVAGTEVVVDPAARFEIELSVRSSDARLVLLDARDDILPATGGRELGAGTTRLSLSPAAPLVPGSRYALHLDGATDRELHDDAGREFAPITFPLLAAGTPPPPEPKAPAKKAPARKAKKPRR